MAAATPLDPSADTRPGALIFRKRLLPWSETFIAAQGGALERYRPVFVGFQVEKRGGAYLAGQAVVPLSAHALVPPLAKVANKAFGYVTPRWRRALAAYRPALVHAHFGVNANAAISLARALEVPLIVTYHGMDITIARTGRGELRERRRAFAAARRLIAVSEFIAGRVREAGAPDEKIVIHHIGVDTTRFSPGEEVERPPNRILFVGRLVAKKGLDHLLRALVAVREAVPDVELLVVGDGSLRARMEALARELEAPVRFLGIATPDEVREHMRRATVLAAPSIVADDGNAEGLPMTIVEAQACGLPVVAFPSGGSAEGVADGRTGFIVPARDEAALAARIIELLGDHERRTRFSLAAREWALEHFDLHRQCAKLERIYDEVVREG